MHVPEDLCYIRYGLMQVALFLLGTINNLPYVVVNSSANILARRSVAIVWLH